MCVCVRLCVLHSPNVGRYIAYGRICEYVCVCVRALGQGFTRTTGVWGHQQFQTKHKCLIGARPVGSVT